MECCRVTAAARLKGIVGALPSPAQRVHRSFMGWRIAVNRPTKLPLPSPPRGCSPSWPGLKSASMRAWSRGQWSRACPDSESSHWRQRLARVGRRAGQPLPTALGQPTSAAPAGHRAPVYSRVAIAMSVSYPLPTPGRFSVLSAAGLLLKPT